MDVSAVADYLGVPVTRIYRWIREDRLPVVKPAGPQSRILIDRHDLDAFLEARRRPALRNVQSCELCAEGREFGPGGR